MVGDSSCFTSGERISCPFPPKATPSKKTQGMLASDRLIGEWTVASEHGAARESAKQNGSCCAKGSNKQPPPLYRVVISTGPFRSFGHATARQSSHREISLACLASRIGLTLLPDRRKIWLLSISRNDDFLAGFATWCLEASWP